jgi:hypothetical protein
VALQALGSPCVDCVLCSASLGGGWHSVPEWWGYLLAVRYVKGEFSLLFWLRKPACRSLVRHDSTHCLYDLHTKFLFFSATSCGHAFGFLFAYYVRQRTAVV